MDCQDWGLWRSVVRRPQSFRLGSGLSAFPPKHGVPWMGLGLGSRHGGLFTEETLSKQPSFHVLTVSSHALSSMFAEMCLTSLIFHHVAVQITRRSLPALQVMLVPEANLYPVPDEVTDKVAAQFSVRIPIHDCYQHQRILRGRSRPLHKASATQCRIT